MTIQVKVKLNHDKLIFRSDLKPLGKYETDVKKRSKTATINTKLKLQTPI